MSEKVEPATQEEVQEFVGGLAEYLERIDPEGFAAMVAALKELEESRSAAYDALTGGQGS